MIELLVLTAVVILALIASYSRDTMITMRKMREEAIEARAEHARAELEQTRKEAAHSNCPVCEGGKVNVWNVQDSKISR